METLSTCLRAFLLAVLFVVLGDVVNALPVDTGNPNLLTGSDERGQGSNVGGDLETAAQYYGGYGYGAYGPHYGYGGHYYGHGPHYGYGYHYPSHFGYGGYGGYHHNVYYR